MSYNTPLLVVRCSAIVVGMNSKTKSVALFLLSAVLVAFVGTGCNTTKGLGKDVEKLGDKIQDKSNR